MSEEDFIAPAPHRPSKRSMRGTLAFFHDVVMTGLAFMLAFYLRVGGEAFTTYREALLNALPVFVLMGAASYRVFALYRGIWRYASTPDLLQIVKAASAAVLAFVLVMFLVTRLDTIPRSIPLIAWFVLLVLLGGPRFVYRSLKDRKLITLPGDLVPVLLVGAGDGAEQFIRSLAANRQTVYKVVGVLDEKGRRVGSVIHGVPVLGHIDEIGPVLAALKAKRIQPQRLILTRGAHEMPSSLVRALFEQATLHGMTLSRIPNPTEFKDALGEGRLELRAIAVEDLLGRPQAALDHNAIAGLIKGRRVLVTGAGGTIGGELVRQIAALEPARLVLVEASEFNLYSIDLALREATPALDHAALLCDVRDGPHVQRIFSAERPELVFHAAALKHVPLVEANPAEGALTNVIGTRNVADAALASGTLAMVLISTDKAIRPISVMGATKRMAEAYCQALDLAALERAAKADAAGQVPTRFMTVRFGNVLDSSGSVVPLFRRQLARGGPLTVTHPEMKRYFMTVREAVELVLQASAHGTARAEERGKLFVLDMGEPVKILDVARQMIRLAGLQPDQDIKVEFTGLRPGEKMFEEILDAAETPIKAAVDGLFVASPRIIDSALLARALGELETAAHKGDTGKVLTILHNIVPDFGAAGTEARVGTGR